MKWLERVRLILAIVMLTLGILTLTLYDWAFLLPQWRHMH
jgi:hypothetical protein